MHRIPVPENIQLCDPMTDKPTEWVGFKRWVIDCILNDQRMGTKPVELARVVRLVGDVRALTVGQPWDVQDDDYQAMKPIVEAPTLALGGPVLMAQLLPFPRAFLDAQYLNDLKAKAEKAKR